MLTPPPPLDGRRVCAGCGAALRASDADGYWLLEGGAWHAGCAPWGRHGFPFGWALAAGERLRSRLGRRAGGPPPGLARALDALAAAAGAWPPSEPVPVLREAARAAAFVVRCERALAAGARRGPAPR
ncbi:MAG TPA: hypothetical protein VFS00_27425 [Polyangiaceae bacterium]|nr:hypothetical protein [Polyangiaceae bacterium]